MTRSFVNHVLRGVLMSGALAFCLVSTGNSLAGTAFFDDFEDGNHADGSPVTWSRFPAPFDLGDFIVQNGSLVVTPAIEGPPPFSFLPNYYETDVVVESPLYHDVNIYTQVRAQESGHSIVGIIALDTYFSDGKQGSSVQGFLGPLLAGGEGTVIDILALHDSGFTPVSRVFTTLSPIENDLKLRLVVQGDTVSFTVWPAGDPEPLQPTLSGQLPEQLRNQDGRVGVLGGNNFTSEQEIEERKPIPFAFPFVNVLPLPVGDFNANGSLDAADLDLLAGGMIARDAKFDLDGDADADLADRLKWVNELKRTWMGDADLNGEFNSGDMVAVFTAGKYENGTAATWSEGDWNGDKLFSSGDMVTAFQGGGYEKGPRAAVSAVPEPSSCVLSLFALLGLTSTTRRLKLLKTS